VIDEGRVDLGQPGYGADRRRRVALLQKRGAGGLDDGLTGERLSWPAPDSRP
jgi:hypothetical protein